MDTGRYKCLAINPYGMARKEFRVLIMVSTEPLHHDTCINVRNNLFHQHIQTKFLL